MELGLGVDAIAPEIRLLSRDDLDGALALSTTAGWNQRIEDWRMLLDLAPPGSFAAVVDRRIVGTAIGIDYTGFGWIAMMLVEPAFRGRGIGRHLLEAAMTAIPPDRPIRLDATPLGRPLYEAHGFRLEENLTRYLSEPEHRSHVRPEQAASTDNIRMTPADLVAVYEQDPAVFRGDRRRVLDWALRLAPGYAFVTRTPAGLAGYCFGREGRLCDQIGPVVAESEDAACALAGAALARAARRRVFVDAFDAHGRFCAWLRAHGFTPQRPLYRMRRPAAGRPSAQPDVRALAEHAIFGPEFG